jgi:2,5-diamino-6-(ribosylamino)-4(3H)-pyrimidinone 5'-phosphate reductase
MDRPRVYANMAMTADGKITSAAREYPRLTTGFDRKTMDRLRAEADAVIIGAGTLRADDPPLHVRHPEMREYRRTLGKPDHLLNVVVTASADLDPTSGFFSSGPAAGRIVATVDEIPTDREERLAAVAEVWTCGSGQVDLARLLQRLKERGVESALLEGGGELNWGFVRDDLLDELYVTIAPVLLGGREAPTLLEGEGLRMDDQRRLRLADVLREGDEIYCRYVVERS